ncbi:hypothetical protein L596_016029 [Steinernema carpocapsae]|uniref:7TM GPCR serpentine receptor class x (Srx) domain-containing protein n=1 Tax=Steinernema carpocapsae TaxID=34508 RepID=A0A4U5NHU2_STECR|nr:hypothetical protein L596_016029 [Steinernema carpocapsae]
MSHLPLNYRYIAGFLYIGLAAITFPIYAIIVKIFLTHKTFSSNISYVILAVLGIFDCFMLIGFAGCGVFTIYDNTFNWIFEKAFLSMMNASRNATFPTILLIAFNRFVVLTKFVLLPPDFYKFTLIGLFAYWLTFTILCMTTLAGQKYFLDFALGAYDYSLKWSPYIGSLEYHINIACLGVALGLYLITVVVLIYRRNQMFFTDRNVLQLPEIRVLAMAMVIFLVYSLDVLVTYFGPQFIAINQMVAIMLMVALECTCGLLNPLLFLIMNSSSPKAGLALRSSLRASTQTRLPCILCRRRRFTDRKCMIFR